MKTGKRILALVLVLLICFGNFGTAVLAVEETGSMGESTSEAQGTSPVSAADGSTDKTSVSENAEPAFEVTTTESPSAPVVEEDPPAADHAVSEGKAEVPSAEYESGPEQEADPPPLSTVEAAEHPLSYWDDNSSQYEAPVCFDVTFYLSVNGVAMPQGIKKQFAAGAKLSAPDELTIYEQQGYELTYYSDENRTVAIDFDVDVIISTEMTVWVDAFMPTPEPAPVAEADVLENDSAVTEGSAGDENQADDTGADEQIVGTVELEGWIYGDTPKSLTATLSGDNRDQYGGPTYQYAVQGSEDWMDAPPQNAGAYKVKAVWSAEGLDDVTANADFTIQKRTLTFYKTETIYTTKDGTAEMRFVKEDAQKGGLAEKDSITNMNGARFSAAGESAYAVASDDVKYDGGHTSPTVMRDEEDVTDNYDFNFTGTLNVKTNKVYLRFYIKGTGGEGYTIYGLPNSTYSYVRDDGTTTTYNPNEDTTYLNVADNFALIREWKDFYTDTIPENGAQNVEVNYENGKAWLESNKIELPSALNDTKAVEGLIEAVNTERGINLEPGAFDCFEFGNVKFIRDDGESSYHVHIILKKSATTVTRAAPEAVERDDDITYTVTLHNGSEDVSIAEVMISDPMLAADTTVTAGERTFTAKAGEVALNGVTVEAGGTLTATYTSPATDDRIGNGKISSKATVSFKSGETNKTLSCSNTVAVKTHSVTYDWGTVPALPAGGLLEKGVTWPSEPPAVQTGLMKGDAYTVASKPADIKVYDQYGNVIGKLVFSGWTDENNGVIGTEDVTIKGGWDYSQPDQSSYTGTVEVNYTYDGVEGNVPTGACPKLTGPYGSTVRLPDGQPYETVTVDGVNYMLDPKDKDKAYSAVVKSEDPQSVITVNYVRDANEDGKADGDQTVAVTVTGAREVFTYDGRLHTVSGYTITGVTVDGVAVETNILPEGVSVSLAEGKEAKASRTDVGTTQMGLSADDFVVSGAGNYTVTVTIKEDGSVTVTPAALTVTTASASKVYDGTPLTAGGNITGLLNGETASVNTTSSIVDRGAEPNDDYTITWGTAESSNYTVTTGSLGTLTVNPRTVTLTSASAGKEYDGTAVRDSTVTVGAQGFVNGQGATYRVTGSQLLVGSSANTFNYALYDNTNPNNYRITKTEGTLTVSSRTSRYVITVRPNGGSAVYDGQTHSVRGLATGDTFTFNGQTYTLSGLSANKMATNAGVYTVSVEGTPVVRDVYGNDVTNEFSITRTLASLTIYQKEVTVRALDQTKTAGSRDPRLTASVAGSLNGDTVSYRLSRQAGNAAGAYTIFVRGEASQGNYAVTFVNGVMTVLAADTPATPRPTATPRPPAIEQPTATEQPMSTPRPTVQIVDNDTPLGELPDATATTRPAATARPTASPSPKPVIITESETPLGAGPAEQTCCILHFLLILAAFLVAVFYTHERKREQAREFEHRSELK